MRLIDADLLKESISKRLKSFNPDGSEIEVADALALVSIMMEIDEQPTAFDVDKVVEQLEKEESKARLELMEDRKTTFEFSSKCRLKAYEKAIKIVKDGGVE